MRHELRQVRAFLTVARLESFTRAAVELHVSQSALTVQVKQLEQELGVLLLDRNKRGVTITVAGRDLLGPLERLVLEDGESIVNYARDLSTVQSGRLSVAALPTVAASLLPAAMRAFSHTHPEVAITIQDVVAEQVRELVAKRAVDFGLGTASRQDKEIEAKPLYKDHMAAFVPARHPLARHAEVSLRDLADCSLILPNRQSSVRTLVEAAFVRNRFAIHVRFETNSMPTALGLVRMGFGVSILPERALDGGMKDVVRVPIRKPALSRLICLLQRRDRALSPAAAKFVQSLQAEITALTRARP